MNQLEKDFRPPEPEAENPKKLTRAGVEGRLERDESLENLDLRDIDLAGLDLEGQSFRGSDIRGMILYGKEKGEGDTIIERRTNIRDSDWTDATIADLGEGVFFGRVDAEGATFGYTESLVSRRKRHKKAGKAPTAEDTGGLFGFDASQGNFKKTIWRNVDFGGGSGYESIFPKADLSQSLIEGSDLGEIDFSTIKINGIKIKDPISLRGMKINEEQISSMAQAIELSDEKCQSGFLEEVKSSGQQKALEDCFGVVIVEVKNE